MICFFSCSITASLRPGLAYPLGTRTGSLSIATWARSLETIKQYSTHRYLVISRGASLLPPVHEVSGVNEVRAALKLFSDGERVSPLGFFWFSLLLVSLFLLSVISMCVNLLSISVNAVTAEVSFSKSASGMGNGDLLTTGFFLLALLLGWFVFCHFRLTICHNLRLITIGGQMANGKWQMANGTSGIILERSSFLIPSTSSAKVNLGI